MTIIVLGVVIAQFFRCMSALLGRARRDIKWVLVAHTVTMFSCVTISTPGGPYLQYISYVDNRGFPGTDVIPPGPVGYEYLVATDPLNSLFYVTFYLNQWLADGFLVGSTLKPVVQVSNVAIPLVVSFLCHFCHELLVHHLTLSDVPRHCGYVFNAGAPG